MIGKMDDDVDEICRRIVADKREGRAISSVISLACELCIGRNGKCKFEDQEGER